MKFALDLAIIIVSLLLMAVILMQSKGSGFSGAFGGDTSSIYRTRRGFERTLYNFTIGIGVVFVILSIIAAIFR
ncbi:MAG TPA: preprotein translocase subunit SecG [Thermomicrobiales bacterium]|nr:preprotein translocase subunit SecG [Chloroflexota bacterium]HQX63408.1 preprotein translocase subunit SecG [Thermomicrobiales bacterium]HBY45347.1 preprotein translocase subunit SecG [Chloroflexota bacterium]HCG30719.1 preprotein translocase subunit SecG [Chloroflexota bacterium]HQZ88814.1 preprotein translocase subunit SecG [Thermomicrobiales bacterium]